MIFPHIFKVVMQGLQASKNIRKPWTVRDQTSQS